MFRFKNEWNFQAPIPVVWEKLSDIESWPRWWTAFRKSMVRITGTAQQPVLLADCEVRGVIPLTFRFCLEPTHFHAPHLIEFNSSGDLVGSGEFQLGPVDGATRVTIRWDVQGKGFALSLLSAFPVTRILLRWNHKLVMKSGQRALREVVEGGATARSQDPGQAK